jgi:predicted GNAT superfamily acetyltransferase
MAVYIRDLHGLDDYRAVVALEQEIWGYTDLNDIVTVPVFIITMKRGGILIGAFDERDRMVGFAFSIVGIKDGKPTQWSHMMGVVSEHRRSGLGRALKLAQRERAIAAGFELMEWTFDPLQALNAHLNFSRLGVVCQEYARNVYGESTSALHKGTPTDRFVVEWHLRAPHCAEQRQRGPGHHRRPRAGSRGRARRQSDDRGGTVDAADVGRPLSRRAAGLDGDPERVHRDAAASAGSCARMAVPHSRDLRDLFRARVSCRRFRDRTATLPACAQPGGQLSLRPPSRCR